MSSKQLILVTAPFNCGYCETAKKELPTLCENKGWELVEIEDEKGEEGVGAEIYPTVMFRVNEKIIDTVNGYDLNEIKTKLK